MQKTKFNFEELEVWQKAVKFSKRVIDFTETINTNRKHYRLIEQLESSATSVAMNIAEGKGRYSKKEFIQFLYIARGSLFETITLLMLFTQNNWLTKSQFEDLKKDAGEISRMLSGLISTIRRSVK